MNVGLRGLRSLTLRLGLIYVAIFLASTAAMFGAVYWFGVYNPLLKEADAVRLEADAMLATDRSAGRAQLLAALQRRNGTGPRRPFHALIAADGRAVNSTIPSWPADPIRGWTLLEADRYRDGQEEDFEALVVEGRLDDGARLIIGRDVEDIDDRDELFTINSAWLVAVAALIAIAGSIAMARAVGQRIDAVTRTARRVIDGDHSERIPLNGTGDDFDELAQTLNLMLDRIDMAMESVRRVSDNVAHELRTPLARLHAELDSLQSATTATDRRRISDRAMEEAARLQAIFDALLRIARIESGRHFAGFRTVDLSVLVADAAEFHAPGAEGRGQSITTDIASLLTARADPDLLFQAISNLLDNAVKYGASGNSIHVRAARLGSRIEISVSDAGPGIPEEYRDRVTERFFRMPATESEPGTGLGLSLVAAIVKLHGWRLEFVDMQPGTCVRILGEGGG